MHRSRYLIYALGLIAALGLSHCARGGRSAAVTIKGSDTMVILGQRWAEAYMAAHPGRIVQVTGGGSGTGIAALINGTTDICQSSRPIKQAENDQLQAKYGQAAHEVLVARDGLAVYAAETNPVDSLTLAEIKAIYTGQVSNWKALGGPDSPIVVYSRENNSGTYVYFKEHVLGDADFAAGVQTLPGTAAVVNAVAQEPHAIGYGGAAYAKGVKELAIKSDAATPGVRPSRDAVLNGSYPISRGLYWYLRKPPEGPLQEFLAYVLSPDGQALVTEVGYYPLQ